MPARGSRAVPRALGMWYPARTMKRIFLALLLGSSMAACGSSESTPVSQPSQSDSGSDQAAPEDSSTEESKTDALQQDGSEPDGPAADGAQSDADLPDTAPDVSPPPVCNFDYGSQFGVTAPLPAPLPHHPVEAPHAAETSPGEIAHADPPPASTYQVQLSSLRYVPPSSLTLPKYDDDLPLFDRGAEWTGPTRCYETPDGSVMLTESEAYDLYQRIAERTTGELLNTHTERRTVVGLRGAYPGQIAWHGNTPNKFNDTLVLLWQEAGTGKHVREFPVNTDTGAVDFGPDSSSSLRPNRRYAYVNGWHNTYNALHIDESAYRVRDDTNGNGHWDSDRNGWLPPATGDDYFRNGSGHNIHMGSVNAPLGDAKVQNWSAGCQVIPGMANWIEFITNAWTAEGDTVDYFLVDVRDIPPAVWSPCTPDGSHACPYYIDTLPFQHTGDTSKQGAAKFGVYNCSSADESGAEVVYELHVKTKGALTVQVECEAGVDIDVHLLEGDDAKACLVRNDVALTYDITPGRYLIVADTFAENGAPLAGSYTLKVSLK